MKDLGTYRQMLLELIVVLHDLAQQADRDYDLVLYSRVKAIQVDDLLTDIDWLIKYQAD